MLRRPGRPAAKRWTATCFWLAAGVVVAAGESVRAQEAGRDDLSGRTRIRSLATYRNRGTAPFGTGGAAGPLRGAPGPRNAAVERPAAPVRIVELPSADDTGASVANRPGVVLVKPGPQNASKVLGTASARAPSSAGDVAARPAHVVPVAATITAPQGGVMPAAAGTPVSELDEFRPFADEEPLREATDRPPSSRAAPVANTNAPGNVSQSDIVHVPASPGQDVSMPTVGPNAEFGTAAPAAVPTTTTTGSDRRALPAAPIASEPSAIEASIRDRSEIDEPDGFGVESLFDEPEPGTASATGAPEASVAEDEVLRPVPEKIDYRKEVPEDMLERIMFQGEPAPLVDTPKPEGGNDENDPARRGGPTRGSEETLGSPPPDFSRLFLRQQTIFLLPGQAAVDYGFRYTWREFRFPTDLGGGFLANARNRTRQLTVPFAFRYGVNERLQLFSSLPVGFAHLEYASPIEDDTTKVFGTGDLFFGCNYLIRKGHGDLPDIVGTLGINAPLAAHPFEFSPGPAALGSGFWGVQASLLATKSYDPVVVFWGFGYGHEFDRSYLGFSLDPGELFFYQFGAGFAVNDSMVLSTQFFGAYRSNLKADGVSISNSGQEPMTLRFALTYTENRCQIVEPFVRVGLTPDVPEADIGVTWTRRF